MMDIFMFFFCSLKFLTEFIGGSTKKGAVQELMYHSSLCDYIFLCRFLQIKKRESLVRDQNPNWSWVRNLVLASRF